MHKANNNSYKFILSSQYFLYFGVMGIFLPYFNLYCYHLNFSGFQIGVLSALRAASMGLCPIVWAALADRYNRRKSIYIYCSFISTALWTFFLCTVDFDAMLLVTLLYGIFYTPIIAFLEAFAMDVLGKEKKSYGSIRAWGSMSFILMVLVFGKIIDNYSVRIILFFILAGSLLQALISTKIPDIKNRETKLFSPASQVLNNRRTIVFLICGFLMLASHGTYYGFFSIHMENLGYDNTVIGFTWALASIAEIIIMLNSKNIFKRFSFENILIGSFIAAALRWFLLFKFISLPMILISQLLHAITYGTFHMASILYIDSLTPDQGKTFGQAVNNAVTYGLGMTAGFIISGAFYDRLGTSGLFFSSGLMAIGGGIVMWFFTSLDQRRKIYRFSDN